VLNLHSRQFLKIISNGIRVIALHYAKTHLSAFVISHIADIQKLMAGKLDKPYKSSLSMTVAAGILFLPDLKFMNIMSGKKQGWPSMSHLPVAIETDREFQFHSIIFLVLSRRNKQLRITVQC